MSKEKSQLESLLLESLNSGKATPMTQNDWINIRAVVRARITQK